MATFCANYILDHEASSLDVLATAAREEKITRARDPLTTVRTAIRHDPRLIELPDGRWQCGLRLLAGNTLTHRVRAATSGRDVLFLGVEAAPLIAFLEHGPLKLVDGGEVTMRSRHRSTWSGPPVALGPPGWLPDLPADALVGLAWSSAGLTVSTVDIASARAAPRNDATTTPQDDPRAERVRTVLARHAQGGLRFDTYPHSTPPLARIIWSALLEVPDLFAEPVLPLDEVLDLPPVPWPGARWVGPSHPLGMDRYEFGDPWATASYRLDDPVPLDQLRDDERVEWW